MHRECNKVLQMHPNHISPDRYWNDILRCKQNKTLNISAQNNKSWLRSSFVCMINFRTG